MASSAWTPQRLGHVAGRLDDLALVLIDLEEVGGRHLDRLDVLVLRIFRLRLCFGLRLRLELGIVLVDRSAHGGCLGKDRLDLKADPGADAVEREDVDRATDRNCQHAFDLEQRQQVALTGDCGRQSSSASSSGA